MRQQEEIKSEKRKQVTCLSLFTNCREGVFSETERYEDMRKGQCLYTTAFSRA